MLRRTTLREVSKEELPSILESMIDKGLIEKQGERQNLSYIFPEQCGSNITDTQEDNLLVTLNKKLMRQ